MHLCSAPWYIKVLFISGVIEIIAIYPINITRRIIPSNNAIIICDCVILWNIPDKKYVFSITQSNYEALIKAGVRVYEFTPGFNHCKNIISDDYIGLVGTVNTDYRSYYLHFEDGVILQDEKIVLEMKQGYLKALEMSHEVTLEECRKFPLYKRIWRAVLKLMAPLF